MLNKQIGLLIKNKFSKNYTLVSFVMNNATEV